MVFKMKYLILLIIFSLFLFMTACSTSETVKEAVKFTLNITVEPAGRGEVAKSPDKTSYEKDEVVRLTPQPVTDWKFDHWEGDLTGGESPHDIVIEADTNIKAVFSEVQSPGEQLPGQPTLSSAEPADGQVTLEYTGVSNAVSYTVRYGTVSGNYSEEVAGITASPVTITNLTNDTTYYFVIVGVNSAGEGAASNEISSTPREITDQPVVTNIIALDGGVDIYFDLLSNVSEYSIKYGTSSGNYPVEITKTITNTGHVRILELTNNTTYYFVVAGISESDSRGPYSEEVSTTPVAMLPDYPYLHQLRPTNEKVILEFYPVYNADYYKIMWKTDYNEPWPAENFYDAVNPSIGLEGLCTVEISGLTNGVKYWFKVHSANDVGFSGESRSLTATPDTFTLENVLPGDGYMELYFPQYPGALGYRVYYGAGSLREIYYEGTYNRPFIVPGLTNGTLYSFSVSYKLGEGNYGPESNVIERRLYPPQ